MVQDAAPVGFEALQIVMREAGSVTALNCGPCMDAALAFVESRVGGPHRSTASVDLLAALHTNVVKP